MVKHYSADFLRMLRNQIPINAVIRDLLNLEVRKEHETFRFRCPLCENFHTATNHKTNLARCFDCCINFNPIDLVMTVGNCGFLDAVKILKKTVSNQSK
jgi:hypothetical protein